MTEPNDHTDHELSRDVVRRLLRTHGVRVSSDDSAKHLGIHVEDFSAKLTNEGGARFTGADLEALSLFLGKTDVTYVASQIAKVRQARLQANTEGEAGGA